MRYSNKERRQRKAAIMGLMQDGRVRTATDITNALGWPEGQASASLRWLINDGLIQSTNVKGFVVYTVTGDTV